MSNTSALKNLNIALLLVALAATNGASARPEGSTSTSGAQIDAELDQVLTRVAKESLSRVKLLDGQSRSRNVTVSANIPGKFIVVHLDSSFVPADYGPLFEDQRSLINNALLHVAEQVTPFSQVKYLYGGRDIYHYFPEIKEADDAARAEGERIWRERQADSARGRTLPRGTADD